MLAAAQLGAERIIAMSRHEPRQQLAREFGATDIVAERGDDGVARIKELTDGIGADAVLECVGTGESMSQALRSTRPGGDVGFVGVPARRRARRASDLFCSHVSLHGGPAPVRRFLPDLIDLVLDPEDQPRQGVRPRPCRWTRSPTATGPWTSAARSRHCCGREALSSGEHERSP